MASKKVKLSSSRVYKTFGKARRSPLPLLTLKKIVTTSSSEKLIYDLRCIYKKTCNSDGDFYRDRPCRTDRDVHAAYSQYPDITPPTVAIQGTYVGADAQTVEQTTTTAIETQVNGSPGMAYMSSNSTGSGVSSITVTFDIGTDINIATLDVQNRVSVAEPTLPEIVKRLGLTVPQA